MTPAQQSRLIEITDKLLSAHRLVDWHGKILRKAEQDLFQARRKLQAADEELKKILENCDPRAAISRANTISARERRSRESALDASQT